jgi:hypothetical protein
MAFGRRYSNGAIVDIGVGTQKKQIHEGQTYNLVEFGDYNAHGGYGYGLSTSFTSQSHTGQLTITHLDNQIVSGTFWFDVEDEDGVIHEIREGRFDMQYTQ